MLLKEVMTEGVAVLSPEHNLIEAAKLMSKLNVGAVPVCNGDRLQGMITDRDITILAVAHNLNPENTRVQDIVVPEIYYCYEDQTIEDATRLMEEKQIRRLPILNKDQRLVGIVSLGDLATRGNSSQPIAQTLKSVSQTTPSVHAS